MTQRRCKDCAGTMVEDELDGVLVWRCTKCWRVDPREVSVALPPKKQEELEESK